MFKSYQLLENILHQIEENINKDINANVLAEQFHISSIHLQRLFKHAFKLPIAGYIRSRRLSASVEDLLNSEKSIIDIAVDYGFDYEQSYIRAFKREFGITPGILRKKKKVVKLTQPIYYIDESRLENQD